LRSPVVRPHMSEQGQRGTWNTRDLSEIAFIDLKEKGKAVKRKAYEDKYLCFTPFVSRLPSVTAYEESFPLTFSCTSYERKPPCTQARQLQKTHHFLKEQCSLHTRLDSRFLETPCDRNSPPWP